MWLLIIPNWKIHFLADNGNIESDWWKWKIIHSTSWSIGHCKEEGPLLFKDVQQRDLHQKDGV